MPRAVVLLASFFGPAKWQAGFTKWGLLLALAYLALFFFVWLPYKAKRIYRQYKAMQATQQFSISEESLWVESERGRGVIPWSDLVKWKHGRGVFLLYPTDAIFYIVPERLFRSASEVAQFKELLARVVKT